MGGSRTIELAGACVSFDWSSSRDRRHVEWLIGDARPSMRAPDLRVRVADAHGPRSERDADLVDGPVSAWFGDDGAHLEHTQGGVADVSLDVLALSPSPDADLRWKTMRQLLVTGLSWWFERRNQVVLHAAAVAHGSSAILIAGPTGRGKSTCTMAALASGWDVLSDDLSIVSCPTDGLPQVFGLPKRPMVDSALLHRVPVLTEPVTDDLRGRRMLGGGLLATGSRRPCALVVVDHAAAAGGIEAFDRKQSLGALVASWPESGRSNALRRQFATLVRLAQLPSFRLALSSSPAERIDHAARALSSVWEASSP